MRRLVRHPSAYFIDYADGTRATLLMLDGAVADYTFAARLRGSNRLESTQFLLPPNPNVAYSACLMHKVEEMLETGQAPYPCRAWTLLVSGMLESSLESKIQGSKPTRKLHISTSDIIRHRSRSIARDTDRGARTALSSLDERIEPKRPRLPISLLLGHGISVSI